MSSASTGGTEGSSPASSPASAASLAMAAPKFGTLVPNRIFVGGISASTSEAELAQLFSAYGNVKATKIISDRAGVSKGYGFVTFETDEEARRLQQESECIILRERKLNIAPAIKKQPFNRSFDGGSGSPPAVPTNTYYYPNGMGLTYQNGLTFYNAGAPAPGTPIAPPTDPATIYQATGVFGPQATSGHQTFAPVMYSCPAPSLYMPQQYQYSPMPYEQYYAGVAAGGGPQYALYASSGAGQQQQQSQQPSQQAQSNGSVSSGAGGGGSGGVINGTGASSPPALGSLLPPPAHFYAPSAPPGAPTHHHHHPPVAAGPPPPQPQLDHLYYSFAAPGPPPVPPQPQHQTIGIGDQPLLLYTTDPNGCQQLTANADSQGNAQEDTRSTSSHSDQPKQQQSEAQQQQQQQQAHQAQSQLSTTPLMSLMPLKYPIMSTRYANYHPLAMHPGGLHQQHQQQQQQQQQHHHSLQHQSPANGVSGHNSLTSERSDVEESGSPSPMHRSQTAAATAAAYIYPATVYIPHGASYPGAAGATVGTSLLPTPGTNYDSPLKLHQGAQQSKPGINSSIGINLGYHRTPNSYSILGGVQQQSYPKSQGYSRKYGSYQGAVGATDRGRYYPNKSGLTSQQYSYVTPRPGGLFTSQILTNFAGSPSSAYNNGQSYGNSRRNAGDQWSESYDNARYGNSRRRDSAGHGRGAKNFGNRESHDGNQSAGKTGAHGAEIVVDESRLVDEGGEKGLPIVGVAVTDRSAKSPVISNNNNCSPPPAPYSPMTRPIPNISPPVSQVQFYATGAQAQTRYHQPQMSHHQSQQQQQQRRFAGLGQSVNSSRKPGGSQATGGETLRRAKSKVNGAMMQTGKLQDENCLGGGGDATGSNIAGRMPITPPATPRNNSVGNANNAGSVGNDPNQISDACHQMQALSL